MLRLKRRNTRGAATTTIECPECGNNVWLTAVKYFHENCPICGGAINKSYVLQDGFCIDRIKYHDAGNLA
jgi:endogenous inhibitor of DNA gyrase (YacG/DUF329 family)